MKKLFFMYSLTLIFLVLILNTSSIVKAETFDVGLTITGSCTPSWSCSVWSETTCGTRSCIDTNACGDDSTKPSEINSCSSGGGSGGGGGGSSGTITSNDTTETEEETYPEGYFFLEDSIIKIEVKKGNNIQKIINVDSFYDSTYSIEVIYPAGYSGDNDFVKTTSNNKRISNGDRGFLGIMVNTENMESKVYVLKLKISNDKSEKEIILNVRIYEDRNLDFDLSLDSAAKIMGDDKQVGATIILDEIVREKLGDNFTVEYQLMDPSGKIIYSSSRQFGKSEDINLNAEIPQDLGEGYYTLVASMDVGNKKYSNSNSFALIPKGKYHPVNEQPFLIQERSNHFLWIIVVSLILVVMINSVLIYRIVHNEARKDEAHKRILLLSRAKKKGFITEAEFEKLTSEKKTEEKVVIRTIPYKNVSDAHAFFFSNGLKANSILEFVEVLKHLDENVFKDHVTLHKNDFAKWIGDVFNYDDVAQLVGEAKTKQELLIVFENFKIES